VTGSETSPAMPSVSLSVTAKGGLSFAFDMSGSSDFDTISIDYGDGTTADGVLRSEHIYANAGAYLAIVTAANGRGESTASATVVAASAEKDTAAYFAHPYTYVIAADLGNEVPVLSGASWLSISDIGQGYVIVSGTPASAEFVGNVYGMVLETGSQTIGWNVTVKGGAGYPVPGFTVVADGMSVTITSVADNASAISYGMGDGRTVTGTGTITHTYSAPGDYVITQTVSNTVMNIPVTMAFSRGITIEEAFDTGSGDDDGNADDEDPPAGDAGGSGGDDAMYAAIALFVAGLAASVLIASRGMLFLGVLIGIVSIAVLAIFAGDVFAEVWP